MRWSLAIMTCTASQMNLPHLILRQESFVPGFGMDGSLVQGAARDSRLPVSLRPSLSLIMMRPSVALPVFLNLLILYSTGDAMEVSQCQ